MTALSPTADLLEVARRVVWFKEPEETLADRRHFLAHVMTFGTVADLTALRESIDREAFIDALDHAPPGIFDARSWSYWNLRFGRRPAPPLPSRRLPS